MKRNYVINYFLGLLALILIFIGGGVFLMNIKAPTVAQPLEGIDVSTVEALDYYSGEFLIVDSYAYIGDSPEEATDFFCYALVKDVYGNTQAVSFSVSESDDNFSAVKKYMCNEAAEIGDCIIKCYAKAQRIGAYPNDIHAWYAESGEVYNEMLGISTCTQMNFEEYCDITRNFISLRKAELRFPQIAALCCTVIGAAFALAAFLIPGLKVYTISECSEAPKAESTETESNE